MKNKKILWVIDSLGRGGAENLLVRSLPYLSERYTIYLLVLGINDYPLTKVEIEGVHKIIQLKGNSKFLLFGAALYMKYLISRIKPDLIKSDLFYSNLLSRFLVKGKIPVYFTIHSILSSDGLAKNKLAQNMEKWVYRSRHSLIAVSQSVLKDYEELIGIKGASHVLPNFVSHQFKQRTKKTYRNRIERILCVGNIKPVKNYIYLFKVINSLKLRVSISIDVYGDGKDRVMMQSMAKNENLPIRFLGSSDRIYDIMHQYDAFLMPSLHEGFGIAAAEAMVVGLPVFVSNTAALVETTFGNAIYFDPNDELSLVEILNSFHSYSEDDWNAFYENVKMLQAKAFEYYDENTYMKRICEVLGA